MFSSEAFVFPLFGKVRFWESIVSWDRATTFAVCTRALAHSPYVWYVWYVWYVCARVCVCVCVRVCTCVCVCVRAMCACAHGENIGATNGNQQSPDALNERSGAGNLCGRHNMALHAPLHRGRGRIYKPQGGMGSAMAPCRTNGAMACLSKPRLCRKGMARATPDGDRATSGLSFRPFRRPPLRIQ